MVRRSGLIATAVIVCFMAVGCGAGPGASGKGTTAGMAGMSMRQRMRMDPGMPMGDDTTASVAEGRGAVPPGPSATARMVCSTEIQRDAAQTLGLASVPRGAATWSSPLYTCRYDVPGGVLVLTVADSRDAAPGTAYFDQLRQSLSGVRRLPGLQAFGLPGFETSSGVVAFLKDGATLEVDARRLGERSAGGRSRVGVAYALAADVIACWSE